jgi:hypothetical protein
LLEAGLLFQGVGETFQRLIANDVAIDVVNQLEVIEIGEDHDGF